MLVEVNLGLIIASAVTIGPFLARKFPKCFSNAPVNPKEDLPKSDPTIQKVGAGFDRAVSVLTGRHSTRGFMPLEGNTLPQNQNIPKTNFNAETSYSAGGQITDEKSSQFIVVQDLQTGRMVTSPTFPKGAIKKTTEKGIAREKVGLRAEVDEEDLEKGMERGFKTAKFMEAEDEGEVAKWSNIGKAK
jgi:hypothetical protein